MQSHLPSCWVEYLTTWWPPSPWRLHLASFALFHLNLGLRVSWGIFSPWPSWVRPLPLRVRMALSELAWDSLTRHQGTSSPPAPPGAVGLVCDLFGGLSRGTVGGIAVCRPPHLIPGCRGGPKLAGIPHRLQRLQKTPPPNPAPFPWSPARLRIPSSAGLLEPGAPVQGGCAHLGGTIVVGPR